MMKKNFSLILSLAMIALVLGCAMPAAASTEGANRPIKAKEPIVKGICANVNKLSDAIGQRLINSSAKLEKNKADSAAALASRQGKRDAQLAASRATWSGKRDLQFTRLQKRASTTAEKAAVDAFKTTMTAAIAAREAAVDKAIADYRAGLSDKMSARQTALTTAITAYKTAVDAAFAQAKSDCGANVNPKTANATLKAALKAAQDKFKADRQAIEKINPDVMKQLTAAKKAAIDKAISDFKTASDNAKAALKAAFGMTK